MEKMDTNPTKYVVFDVETNGLKSKKDDLLSISFYKPDDGKEYCKFLPLELNRKIVTTHINGITEKDLASSSNKWYSVSYLDDGHYEMDNRSCCFFQFSCYNILQPVRLLQFLLLFMLNLILFSS